MQLPAQLQTALRKITELLTRMAGGYITIEETQIKTNDPAFNVDGCVLVRFDNCGQTPVKINNRILMPGQGTFPGDALQDGDSAGPGLRHDYRITFLAPIGTGGRSHDDSSVLPPIKYAGNHVEVMLMRRNLRK